ncbi:MAG: alpha/beta fold hydrolase [Dehalococcoidia bacterium]
MSERLFVRRMGRSGPVVVLLHGLGASSRIWGSVADELADDAMILCPDLLGFGRSPWPHAAYSVADHLAALDATFEGLDRGAGRIVLGGHSTGAVLALEWAAAHPERFAGVVLVSLPVYGSAAEARAWIRSLSPLAWATVARPDLGELICGVMCATRPFWRAVMPLLLPHLPPATARDVVLHDWVSYSGTPANVIIDHHLEPAARRLAEAGVPVQLVHGTRDRTAPIERARALADACGWPLTVLDGQGHDLIISGPGTCAAALRRANTGTG